MQVTFNASLFSSAADKETIKYYRTSKKNEREILYGTEVFDSDVGPVTVVSNNEASRTLF